MLRVSIWERRIGKEVRSKLEPRPQQLQRWQTQAKAFFAVKCSRNRGKRCLYVPVFCLSLPLLIVICLPGRIWAPEADTRQRKLQSWIMCWTVALTISIGYGEGSSFCLALCGPERLDGRFSCQVDRWTRSVRRIHAKEKGSWGGQGQRSRKDQRTEVSVRFHSHIGESVMRRWLIRVVPL